MLCLQKHILRLHCLYSLVYLTVHILLKLSHLNPILLHHLQPTRYLTQPHNTLSQLHLQTTNLQLQQSPLLLHPHTLPPPVLPPTLQLLLPLHHCLTSCFLLLGYLGTKGVLLLQHVINHGLDAFLVVEPLEVPLLLRLVTLALS